MSAANVTGMITLVKLATDKWKVVWYVKYPAISATTPLSFDDGAIHLTSTVFAIQAAFGVHKYGCTEVIPLGVEVMSQLASRDPITLPAPDDWGSIEAVVGEAVGDVGLDVGILVGLDDGHEVGIKLGPELGENVGNEEGGFAGTTVGRKLGISLGCADPLMGGV